MLQVAFAPPGHRSARAASQRAGRRTRLGYRAAETAARG
jgi:hypothetical protein